MDFASGRVILAYFSAGIILTALFILMGAPGPAVTFFAVTFFTIGSVLISRTRGRPGPPEEE